VGPTVPLHVVAKRNILLCQELTHERPVCKQSSLSSCGYRRAKFEQACMINYSIIWRDMGGIENLKVASYDNNWENSRQTEIRILYQ